MKSPSKMNWIFR